MCLQWAEFLAQRVKFSLPSDHQVGFRRQKSLCIKQQSSGTDAKVCVGFGEEKHCSRFLLVRVSTARDQ